MAAHLADWPDGLVVCDVRAEATQPFAGKLAVMIGGSEEAVARCREPFGRWAALVLHVGPVGAGTKMKLARNLLQFCTYAAVGEAQRLAEAAGVSLQDMAAVVRHSDAL